MWDNCKVFFIRIIKEYYVFVIERKYRCKLILYIIYYCLLLGKLMDVLESGFICIEKD